MLPIVTTRPNPALRHRGHHGVEQANRRLEVGLDLRVDVGVAHGFELGVDRARRADHEHVDRPEFRDRRRHQRRGDVRAGDVDVEARRAASRRAQLGDEPRGLLAVREMIDGDVRAHLAEHPRDRRADAAGSAGHQRRASGQRVEFAEIGTGHRGSLHRRRAVRPGPTTTRRRRAPAARACAPASRSGPPARGLRRPAPAVRTPRRSRRPRRSRPAG